MTQWIISSSLLILAVMIIRALGRDRLSARLRYALWGLVLLRLLCPVNVGESVLSVQNLMPEETRQTQISETYDPSHTIQTGETIQMPQMSQAPVTEGQETHFVNYPMVIWAIGAVLVGGVFLMSNLRFYLRLRRSRQRVMTEAVPVYESAAVETPCLFGFPRAAVYVTPAVMEDGFALRHVLAHELTHYRHLDHVWSVLRCLCVTVHWYNPLVWAAAFLSQKDGEPACDEGALRRLGSHERNAYARTLLDLTCVGYRGMLTAATSMTGSESDLKTRVLRIVKNPKMPLWAGAAVLVIAAIAAVSLFTGAKTPDLEGVWRMDMEILGVGTNGDSTAYMEYEFREGRGLRTDYVDGAVRSAEAFTYTINGETVTLEFPEVGPVRDYTWVVDGDTLTLSADRGDLLLTKVERKSVPYLPEGYIAPLTVAEGATGQSVELSAVQTVRLLALLRSGTVVEHKTEQDFPEGDYNYAIIGSGVGLNFADGVLCKVDGERVEHYVLSNGADIEGFFRDLPLGGERFHPNMETSGFVPSDLVGITEARMILYGKAYSADPAQLAFLEELLSTAEDMGYPTACPFEGYLEVTRFDGRVLAVVPALDSCSAFMIGDTCYEYGKQFAYDDEGSYDNTALLAVFGLNHDMIMGLWESVFGGEVIGTTEDIGDVVRVQNDVMEPAYMTDEARETMMGLLAEGIGAPMGEEEISFDTTYYTIFSSGQSTADGYVTLTDTGRFYMDGVRYELSTSAAVRSILEEQYRPRITLDGRDTAELSGVVGEFLYPELSGVPEDTQVLWSSENETVCTVTGDARGAEIYIKKKGVSAVSVQWQEDGEDGSDYIVVYGKNP